MSKLCAAPGPASLLAVAWLVLAGTAAWAAEPAPADTTVVGETIINPELARAKVTAARVAAGEDRHHEAVADYLEALSHDATLVPVVAQEIAYQKLWREDAVRSIFYFRRYLARHPEQDNREVRKGLALAYSWSGHQPEAVALYRALVAEDSTDGAARVGLARSLVWNNELRTGWAELGSIVAGFPDDDAGRESRDFQLVVLDGYTTPLELRAEGAWDSDDLDSYRLTGTGTWTVLGNKLLQAAPSWGLFRQPGQPDLHNLRLSLGFHTALAHNWALHSYGWVNRYTSGAPLFGGTENLDWTVPGGDLWLTWLPAPRVRVDFGGNSAPVETYIALDRHLHYEQANLSADYRLGRRLSTTLAGTVADFSDGNSRRRGSVRLAWRREGTWELSLGPVLTYMDYALAYPGGYWSPDWVRNGSLEATVKTRSRHWTWRLSGSVGREKESGAEALNVGGASLRAGWRCSENWLLAVEGGHSRSSFGSASGFHRTSAGLSARAFF